VRCCGGVGTLAHANAIGSMSVMGMLRRLRLDEQVFWFRQLRAEFDLRSNFASFYAVEHNPDSQIPAAVFELVLRSCGDKQQVACLE